MVVTFLVQGCYPTDFITSSYSAFIDQKRPAPGLSIINTVFLICRWLLNHQLFLLSFPSSCEVDIWIEQKLYYFLTLCIAMSIYINSLVKSALFSFSSSWLSLFSFLKRQALQLWLYYFLTFWSAHIQYCISLLWINYFIEETIELTSNVVYAKLRTLVNLSVLVCTFEILIRLKWILCLVQVHLLWQLSWCEHWVLVRKLLPQLKAR